MSALTVVGVVGGPEPGGRTATAVAGVLSGAADAGAGASLLELSMCSTPRRHRRNGKPRTPSYSAARSTAPPTARCSGPAGTHRAGKWGETTAAATVLTGASGHHFLAANDLRGVLAGFFAVQVLAPGLYLDHGGYVDRTTLTAESAAVAEAHGAALVDLAAAVRGSAALRALTSQVSQLFIEC